VLAANLHVNAHVACRMGCCCSKKSAQGVKGPKIAAAPAPVPIGKTANGVVTKDIIRQKVEQAAKTRVLALRECGLKALPEDATSEELKALHTADLAINRMAKLPPTIQVWSVLQTLDISDNVLEALPDTISNLTQMKKLILSRNRLCGLPETIGEMNLTELICDGNMLLELPNVFGGPLAKSLGEFDVSNNRLQQLPPSICSLQMITRLLLHTNTLGSLPLQARSYEALARLQYVNAADNCIEEISKETLELPFLDDICLKGNPMDRLVLQATPGFEDFALRRKNRLDQKIEQKVVGDIDLAMCGL